MKRTVVVMLWTGSVIIDRLGPTDPEPELADLDAIATAWTAANDGVRPSVRILEEANLPNRARGPAGSAPGGTQWG